MVAEERKFTISDLIYAFQLGSKSVGIDFLIKEMGLDEHKVMIDQEIRVKAFYYCVDLACEYFLISKESFFSSSRKQDLVSARQIVAYIMRYKYRMSATEIGKRMNRDHATSIHSCKVVTNYLETNDEQTINAYTFISSKMDEMEEKIKEQLKEVENV